MSLETIRAGFIPLVDSAPLIVAAELGFAEAEGLHLDLARETSWATLRDRLAVSRLDVAHMLAPMPIAGNLGVGPLPVEVLVPMALGTGGNAISVSNDIWNELAAAIEAPDFDAAAACKAFAALVHERRRSGKGPLTLGIVHAFSAHHYELAHWLASGGLRPGRDIELVVLPPPLMPDALERGQIDGFCAGEPWGTVATARKAGVILTTNAHIWRNSPEKVLGVRISYAAEDEDRLQRLVRAVFQAAQWCDQSENTGALTLLLSRAEFLAQPAKHIEPSLNRVLTAPDGTARKVEDFLSFSHRAATFPWTSHALWFYAQMIRWGQTRHTAAAMQRASDTYRPDIYRAALEPLNVAVPSANAKVEGALAEQVAVGTPRGDLQLGPDAFFDGHIFDPDQVEAYISELSPPGH